MTHNEHRYLMTVLATMRNENFEVSRIEIDRAGVTYTIDTIEELKRMCRPDVRLYFITGADAIHQIMTWKESERLLGMCDFVAVTRPGYDKSKLFQDIGEIREKFSSRVHYMEVPALAISSSDIRERAKRGAPIKYLLPQEVEDYIHKFGLYQDDAEDEVKFMLPVETMQEKLQSALSVKRYIHTMGVAEEAVKLEIQLENLLPGTTRLSMLRISPVTAMLTSVNLEAPALRCSSTTWRWMAAAFS